MARHIEHTITPEWVNGSRVAVTYPANHDRPSITVEGTVVEPKPRRGDPGPYRILWVELVSPFSGKTEDRPFPPHWVTLIATPDPAEGDAA